MAKHTKHKGLLKHCSTHGVKKSLKIHIQNRELSLKNQKCLIIKLHCREQDDYYSQRRKRGINTKSSLRNIITKNPLHKNQMHTKTLGCKDEISSSLPGEPKSCR